jgi:hypothetical protein
MHGFCFSSVDNSTNFIVKQRGESNNQPTETMERHGGLEPWSMAMAPSTATATVTATATMERHGPHLTMVDGNSKKG